MKPSSLKPRALILCLLFGSGFLFGDFDHSLLDDLLKTQVDSGLVNYRNLKTDPRLTAYLAQLEKADLSSLKSVPEEKAFWINAYNAYTLKLIVDHYPLNSIIDIKVEGYDSPWKIPLARVANQIFTLDHIENGILRPRYSDSRIHYALVCAARSCPQLRNEAYTAAKLENQLDEQGRWFMIHRNTIKDLSRTATLSKVFEWYAGDFGSNQRELLQTMIPFVDEPTAQSWKSEPNKWKLSFSEWDWRLNSQH